MDVVLQLAELREKIRKRRFEEEKNVMGSQSIGRAPSVVSSFLPPPPQPFQYEEPLQTPRSHISYLYESPRARSPSIVQARPETPTLQTMPKEPARYTEEDLEDVRSVFGL